MFSFARSFNKLAAIALLVAMVLLSRPVNSHAQSFGSAIFSALPVQSIQRYLGPIAPQEGFQASFRSEGGGGLILGSLRDARLRKQGDASALELDLKAHELNLDKWPASYDAFTTLRFWRLGLRMGYSHFENRSKKVHGGKIINNGFRLGGAFDAVQLKWMTIGAALDHYFYEPLLKGAVETTADNEDYFELRADSPTTAGPYIRYVPPEIIGVPVHMEAFYFFPVSETKFTNYGAALVFRPQIYRFDASIKALWERRHLSFTASQSPANPGDQWGLKCEWGMFGLEFAMYF